MSTLELDRHITELRQMRVVPTLVNALLAEAVARRKRTVERLHLDTDGILWLETSDPLEHDGEPEVIRLGEIADVSCRRVPSDLWDEYDRLLAEWQEDSFDYAGQVERDYRACKGY